MPEHPHVHIDVTAALQGAPSVVLDIHDRMTAEAALAASRDLRSASLVAAQLLHERDQDEPDATALDLVRGA